MVNGKDKDDRREHMLKYREGAIKSLDRGMFNDDQNRLLSEYQANSAGLSYSGQTFEVKGNVRGAGSCTRFCGPLALNTTNPRRRIGRSSLSSTLLDTANCVAAAPGRSASPRGCGYSTGGRGCWPCFDRVASSLGEEAVCLLNSSAYNYRDILRSVLLPKVIQQAFSPQQVAAKNLQRKEQMTVRRRGH